MSSIKNILTEKEKIFLSCLEFEHIEKTLDGATECLYLSGMSSLFLLLGIETNLEFKGLEWEKQYTREELLNE